MYANLHHIYNRFLTKIIRIFECDVAQGTDGFRRKYVGPLRDVLILFFNHLRSYNRSVQCFSNNSKRYVRWHSNNTYSFILDYYYYILGTDSLNVM